MEQVNEAQPQSQPPSQRFYALEQLGELAGTITLISEGLQAYREQVAGLLAGQKKAEAFELYRLLEQGYIRVDRTEIVDGRARTYYAVTPEGTAYLNETAREYEELSAVFSALLKGGAGSERH